MVGKGVWEILAGISNGELWEPENDRLIVQASMALDEEMPDTQAWKWAPDTCYPCDYSPMMTLLGELASGSADEASPRPVRFKPEDITFHEPNPEEFEELLFQRPRRGAVSFIWGSVENGSFYQPEDSFQRWAILAKDKMWDWLDPSLPERQPIGFDAVAICFSRGIKLEVYAAPPQWEDLVERVRVKLDHMTAKEKAVVDLPVELQSFTELLGWEAVSKALKKLRPDQSS